MSGFDLGCGSMNMHRNHHGRARSQWFDRLPGSVDAQALAAAHRAVFSRSVAFLRRLQGRPVNLPPSLWTKSHLLTSSRQEHGPPEPSLDGWSIERKLGSGW